MVPELAPELEDQLNQRRARVRRLGLINPEAAQDYEAESTRYSFLSAQVQDLRQAEADLRQVIAELDELTRQEFSRTYAAVDKQFRSIFTRLFGGGSAHLALTDPDNLVETGIEIEARLAGPPRTGAVAAFGRGTEPDGDRAGLCAAEGVADARLRDGRGRCHAG